MGLCKCRRKVTTWCFVHKIFVCENCVVSDHANCVVKNYSDWLEDPEYENATCTLCNQDINSSPFIRLTCLHLFHVECLNKYGATFPPNTALAGYTCPTCSKPIPPAPEADPNMLLNQKVKEFLAQAPWMQLTAGPSDSDSKSETDSTQNEQAASQEQSSLTVNTDTSSSSPPHGGVGNPPSNASSGTPGTPPLTEFSSVVASRKSKKDNSPFQDIEEEDKYQKRSVVQLFSFLGLGNKQVETANKPTTDPSEWFTPKWAALACASVFVLFVIALTINSYVKAPA